jgi:hypothetical protein
MRQIDIDDVEGIKAKLDEITEGAALFADGLDGALIGIGRRFNEQPVACYSIPHILDQYQRDGMSYEEAVEFFEYNVIGGWHGEYTPMFVDFEGF